MDTKHWTWWPMTDWTHRCEEQTRSVSGCMWPVRARWTVWTCKNCAVASWVRGAEKRLSSVTSCIYFWTELLICLFFLGRLKLNPIVGLRLDFLKAIWMPRRWCILACVLFFFFFFSRRLVEFGLQSIAHVLATFGRCALQKRKKKWTEACRTCGSILFKRHKTHSSAFCNCWKTPLKCSFQMQGHKECGIAYRAKLKWKMRYVQETAALVTCVRSMASFCCC